MSYRAVDTNILDTVNVNTDTFQVLVNKFNLVVDHLRNTVVTVSNTSAYQGNTTGNGFITGIFGANTLVASVVRGGNVTASGTLTVNSAVSVPNTLSVTANLTVTTGTANLFSANVRGAMDVANTLNVLRATTLANTLTVTGNTSVNNYIIHKTDWVTHAIANTDLGTGLTAINLFTFLKADYTSAKILLQTRNGANVNVTEALMIHDGTNAPLMTVYGRIDAPEGSNNGVLSCDSNTTHVRIRYTQNTINTSTKLHLQLVK